MKNVSSVKQGKVDPGTCGSGKKYKEGCADKDEAHPVELNNFAKGSDPTPAESDQLAALFNAKCYSELESLTCLLVKQYPDSGFAWKALSAALQLQGKNVLPALQQATKLLPDDAEAYYSLGNAQLEIGQSSEALASYRRALEIKPEFVEALCNLGLALQALGQLEGAVTSYRQALKIKPGVAEVHYNMGNALQELVQLEGAKASYRQSLEIKPDYAEAYYNLGNSLQELGQPQEAVASYQQALDIKPDYVEAHINLGNVLQELGQLEVALESYRRSLEIEVDFALAQCNKGTLITRCRHEVIVHANLGNVLLDLGDLSAAEKHFNIALRLDPEQAQAHQGLACIFHRRGNEERSRHHRDMGFGKLSLSTLAYCGRGEAVHLLVLVSASGGNIPRGLLIDREVFQTTLIAVEYFDSQLPLPYHQLVFNAIGDADLCQGGLEIAAWLLEKTQAPIINRPETVLQTGRLVNAKRLGSIPGVVSPRMALVSKEDFYSGHALNMLEHEGIVFPFLLRPPGFHGGNYFVHVENQEALNAALAELPGESQLAIEFLDSQSEDKLFRKYRVMAINGAFYPLHMAISTQWKVHYFSSDMDKDDKYRNEEKTFLNDFHSYIGSKVMLALEEISKILGLDYCGIDFGIDRKGNLLLYEANATMRINHLSNDKWWDYRRTSIENALAATKRMFVERIGETGFIEHPLQSRHDWPQ